MRFRSHRAILGACAAVVALAAASLLGLSVPAALANDTAVGGIGGVVYPLASTDIRMEAETVQVVCYREFAAYRIDFQFVNEGEFQTVQLGFPFVVTESGFMGTAPIGFRAFQDDRPLAVTLGHGVSQQDLIDGEKSLGYYLHTATFPPGETMITVSYLAVPTVSAGSRFNELAPPEFTAAQIGGWAAHYGYWLHTGAGWKGTIGKSVVRFRLADSFKGWAVDVPSSVEGSYPGNTTNPESYVKTDDRTYQWVFEEYEPTEANDIILAFTRPNLYGAPGEYVPVSYGALGNVKEGTGGLTVTTVQLAGGQVMEEPTGAVWGTAAPGKGGSVRFTIEGDRRLQEIRIVPGRTDTLMSFGEYGRPKTLKVTLSDGKSSVFTLKDEPALQKLAVSGEAEWVRFDVLDVYPGSKTDDTYISLVDFGNQPAPGFETFERLLVERAPPRTAPPVLPQDTPGDAVINTIYPSTTSVSVVAVDSTSVSTTTSDTIPQREESQRPLWPAIVGAVVAAVALGVLVYLVTRLRRAGRR